MATARESCCHNDPNFAVVCSFIDKFGERLGLPDISFADLQAYLEDTKNVPEIFIDMHVRLLRRIGKSIVTDRWERGIVKFCYYTSRADSWEFEEFGYRKARTETKIRLLKNLLEAQFDFNIKFKEKINNLEPEQLRYHPVGRDRNGIAYWYLLDKDLNLRIYSEEQDAIETESWQIVCRNRDELAKLLSFLQAENPTTEWGKDEAETKEDEIKEDIDDVKKEHDVKCGKTEVVPSDMGGLPTAKVKSENEAEHKHAVGKKGTFEVASSIMVKQEPVELESGECGGTIMAVKSRKERDKREAVKLELGVEVKKESEEHGSCDSEQKGKVIGQNSKSNTDDSDGNASETTDAYGEEVVEATKERRPGVGSEKSEIMSDVCDCSEKVSKQNTDPCCEKSEKMAADCEQSHKISRRATDVGNEKCEKSIERVGDVGSEKVVGEGEKSGKKSDAANEKCEKSSVDCEKSSKIVVGSEKCEKPAIEGEKSGKKSGVANEKCEKSSVDIKKSGKKVAGVGSENCEKAASEGEKSRKNAHVGSEKCTKTVIACEKSSIMMKEVADEDSEKSVTVTNRTSYVDSATSCKKNVKEKITISSSDIGKEKMKTSTDIGSKQLEETRSASGEELKQSITESCRGRKTCQEDKRRRGGEKELADIGKKVGETDKSKWRREGGTVIKTTEAVLKTRELEKLEENVATPVHIAVTSKTKEYDGHGEVVQSSMQTIHILEKGNGSNFNKDAKTCTVKKKSFAAEKLSDGKVKQTGQSKEIEGEVMGDGSMNVAAEGVISEKDLEDESQPEREEAGGERKCRESVICSKMNRCQEQGIPVPRKRQIVEEVLHFKEPEEVGESREKAKSAATEEQNFDANEKGKQEKGVCWERRTNKVDGSAGNQQAVVAEKMGEDRKRSMWEEKAFFLGEQNSQEKITQALGHKKEGVASHTVLKKKPKSSHSKEKKSLEQITFSLMAKKTKEKVALLGREERNLLVERKESQPNEGKNQDEESKLQCFRDSQDEMGGKTLEEVNFCLRDKLEPNSGTGLMRKPVEEGEVMELKKCGGSEEAELSHVIEDDSREEKEDQHHCDLTDGSKNVETSENRNLISVETIASNATEKKEEMCRPRCGEKFLSANQHQIGEFEKKLIHPVDKVGTSVKQQKSSYPSKKDVCQDFGMIHNVTGTDLGLNDGVEEVKGNDPNEDTIVDSKSGEINSRVKSSQMKKEIKKKKKRKKKEMTDLEKCSKHKKEVKCSSTEEVDGKLKEGNEDETDDVNPERAAYPCDVEAIRKIVTAEDECPVIDDVNETETNTESKTVQEPESEVETQGSSRLRSLRKRSATSVFEVKRKVRTRNRKKAQKEDTVQSKLSVDDNVGEDRVEGDVRSAGKVDDLAQDFTSSLKKEISERIDDPEDLPLSSIRSKWQGKGRKRLSCNTKPTEDAPVEPKRPRSCRMFRKSTQSLLQQKVIDSLSSEDSDDIPLSKKLSLHLGKGRGRGHGRGRQPLTVIKELPTAKASPTRKSSRVVKRKKYDSDEEYVVPRGRGRSRGYRRKLKSSTEESEEIEDSDTEESMEEMEELLRRSTRAKFKTIRKPLEVVTVFNEDKITDGCTNNSDDELFLPKGRNARRAAARLGTKEQQQQIVDDDKPCCKCYQYDHPELILLCDKCDSGYHIGCLKPLLMAIPEGDWFCPPCEHKLLVEKLTDYLKELDNSLKKKERLMKRKERLAFVGISLDNILKEERKENVEPKLHKKLPPSTEEAEAFATRSCRARKSINYQFTEYDELIDSAIQDDVKDVEKPAMGRGKDMANIEEAEGEKPTVKRKKKARRRLTVLDDFSGGSEDSEEYKASDASDTEATPGEEELEGMTDSSDNTLFRSARSARRSTCSRRKKYRRRYRDDFVVDEDEVDDYESDESGYCHRPRRSSSRRKVNYREMKSEEEEEEETEESEEMSENTSDFVSDESGNSRTKVQPIFKKKAKRVIKSDSDNDSDSVSTVKKSRKMSDFDNDNESGSSSSSSSDSSDSRLSGLRRSRRQSAQKIDFKKLLNSDSESSRGGFYGCAKKVLKNNVIRDTDSDSNHSTETMNRNLEERKSSTIPTEEFKHFRQMNGHDYRRHGEADQINRTLPDTHYHGRFASEHVYSPQGNNILSENLYADVGSQSNAAESVNKSDFHIASILKDSKTYTGENENDSMSDVSDIVSYVTQE